MSIHSMMGKIKNGRAVLLIAGLLVAALVPALTLLHPQKVFADALPAGKSCPSTNDIYYNYNGLCEHSSTVINGQPGCPAPYTMVTGTAICGAQPVDNGAGNGAGSGSGTDTTANAPGGSNANAGAGTGTQANTDTNQDDDSPTLDCQILSANPLNWVVCPIIVGIQEAVQGLNNAIDALLTVDVSGAQGTVFGDEFHNAWGQFRLFAVGFIIIAGLVMLASQAFGFELFDAYTVRKVLPRLVIAIIFITISWDLMKFLISLTNDVGNSIRAIIYQPFKQAGLDDALTLGSWTKFVAILIGGAALFTLGIAAVFSFLLTAALGALIGFVILLARQLVIMLLVMISPVAIACYVLPNTQKAFNFWKDTLLSMLVAFPIISAFIAIGRVFAVVAYHSTNTITLIAQIEAFIAFFLPYFLLPFAFKLAGGALGTISGMVNDRGKGAFDRLSGFRGNQASKNMRNWKAGSRFNPESKLTKFTGGSLLNRAGSQVGGIQGVTSVWGKRNQAARAGLMLSDKASMSKENHQFAAQAENEGAMAALALGANAAKMRQLSHYQIRDADGKVTGYKEDAIQNDIAAARAIGVNRRTMSAGADALSQSGKVIANRQEADMLYDTVSGGNGAMRGAVKGSYQYNSRRAGRADIGRNSDYESIRELNSSTMGQLKPLALKNLLETDKEGNNAFSRVILSGQGSPAEMQHAADVLYSSRHSTYTSAEQQAAISQAIQHIETHPEGQKFMKQAIENYNKKYEEGRKTGRNADGESGDSTDQARREDRNDDDRRQRDS